MSRSRPEIFATARALMKTKIWSIDSPSSVADSDWTHPTTDERPQDFDFEMSTQVRLAMERLPLPHSQIIQLSFGFNSDPLPMKTIGKLLGIERHKVAKIRDEALQMLRETIVGAD